MAPVTPEQFLDEHFGKMPLHIPGDPDKFADIFSWGDLNQLTNMTSVWSSKTMQLVLDTERIDDERYCSKGVDRDQFSVMKPDFHKVAHFMEQGATLNLIFVETLHDGIAAVSRALQTHFSATVECNVYVSWKERQAFSSHFDTMDVFVLHIAGEKVWRLYENRFELPAETAGYRSTSFAPETHEKNRGRLMRDVTMTPGSLLYVPKGIYHDALATSGASLHLTFGLEEARGFEVMKDIFDSLPHDPLFRECLPGLDDRDGLADYLRRMGDRLKEVLSLPEIVEQTRNFQKRVAFAKMPGFSLPSPAFDQTFRVTSRPVKVVRRGKALRLKFGGREADLGEGKAEMVEWILAGDYFDIDSLADAFDGGDAVLELIDALVEIGVIEPVAWT